MTHYELMAKAAGRSNQIRLAGVVVLVVNGGGAVLGFVSAMTR